MSMDEFGSILSNVIMNWDTIISDPDIARVVDMELNKFCRQMKQASPYMMDSMIQANILSWSLFMLYTMCTDQPNHSTQPYDISTPD